MNATRYWVVVCSLAILLFSMDSTMDAQGPVPVVGLTWSHCDLNSPYETCGKFHPTWSERHFVNPCGTDPCIGSNFGHSCKSGGAMFCDLSYSLCIGFCEGTDEECRHLLMYRCQ
jgi:hypothetical protein